MAINPVGSIQANSESDTKTNGHSSAKSSSSSKPFSLGELLDIINPLQHIPGVNTLYRQITGDEASVRSRVAGSSLYGLIAGPLGMAGLVAGNLAEMKLSGVLDAAAAQEKSTVSVDVIEQKINRKQIVSAPDMTSSIQRGIPILPVKTTEIPPLFGNVASAEPLAIGNEKTLLDALSGNKKTEGTTTSSEQAKSASFGLPEVDKLSLDARNLLPEDMLRKLQERHRNTIANS
ncbi:hypothetical protein [Pseudovibrio sp. Tun.PSC04-5.I4]|uniref:hypothetical protein n=1 Tax=Pseudovibrio sp. Tun.PSC04-5.I4 TaxID=1798213 RepID=UPI00088C3EC6|nr:hypothetical protein [Pseudovibrio sp. Tun.PSC04-5.I4]SDQ92169.1 hypothetical protein SAMN04515695_1904 [Pseudovibrio sp. Tun.PSC04-5.I4]